jgi:hypothetical protein
MGRVSNPYAPPEPGKKPTKVPAPKPTPEDRAKRRATMAKALADLTPEQRANLASVNRSILYFGVTALGAMIGISLPLPWPAVGVALLVLAIVIAIRGIAKAQKTPMAGTAILYLALGLGMCAMFAIYAVSIAATWPQQWDYQQCVAQSQTVQGQDACRATLQETTKDRWSTTLTPKK